MKRAYAFQTTRRDLRRAKAAGSGARIVQAIRAKQSLSRASHDNVQKEYVPTFRFSDFLISPRLKQNIELRNYTVPTPIQDQTIPIILAGRDVVGTANTGTGKTAAFLIPLIDKALKNKNERVFILAPTRELATQIYDELGLFARGLGIERALCIGGAGMQRQKADLTRNPHFVIGTPGRIKDFIRQKVLNLSRFNNVVLDEVDRMVDIGFIADVKYLISLLPKNRQSLFFSATVSPGAMKVLSVFVQNPVTVSVVDDSTAKNIDENIINVVSRDKKTDQLHDVLIQKDVTKSLVFGRTKWGIEKLTNQLIRRGFKAGSIHGNKRQSQRQRVLDQFRRNEINVLLATDLASRGLDICDVSHVINYDMPATYDDYIHRIGRTGRANKKGVALTFVE